MADGDKGAFEKAGSGIGGLAGRAADSSVDLVNSMISNVANTIGGWWSDRTADEAGRTFIARGESSCRQHFENARGETYDSVRPLYQFGHLAGQNPAYQGRSFEEVEDDLKSAWTHDHTQRFGDWNSIRDYIQTGYGAQSAS